MTLKPYFSANFAIIQHRLAFSAKTKILADNNNLYSQLFDQNFVDKISAEHWANCILKRKQTK